MPMRRRRPKPNQPNGNAHDDGGHVTIVGGGETIGDEARAGATAACEASAGEHEAAGDASSGLGSDPDGPTCRASTRTAARNARNDATIPRRRVLMQITS